MDEWIDGWMDGQMDGGMDGQMDHWMDEWMEYNSNNNLTIVFLPPLFLSLLFSYVPYFFLIFV